MTNTPNKEEMTQEDKLEHYANEAQRLVLHMQKIHGTEKSIELIRTMLGEMSEEEGKYLRRLVMAMQLEAIGDAGATIH